MGSVENLVLGLFSKWNEKLFYLFLTVLGFHCCMGFFSSYGEWGLLSSCGALASHCCGFSCCGAGTLGARTSVVGARGAGTQPR